MSLEFKRMLAFIIDVFVIACILVIFKIFSEKVIFLKGGANQLFYIGLILSLLRDLYSWEGSFGKRKMKLKIVDKSIQHSTFSLRKILRNFTNVLWPIELIYFFISRKRIADVFLKLDVVDGY